MEWKIPDRFYDNKRGVSAKSKMDNTLRKSSHSICRMLRRHAIMHCVGANSFLESTYVYKVSYCTVEEYRRYMDLYPSQRWRLRYWKLKKGRKLRRR